MKDEILKNVEKYYTEKALLYGTNHKGVDWNSKESQELRFQQLLKVINDNEKFTLADLGCGYGYLYEYMENKKYKFNYIGLDLSKQMILNAKNIYKDNLNCKFINDNLINEKIDYCVASGIFNVKLDVDYENWTKYVIKTIEHMNAVSRKGFAFNCLTSYSDKEFTKEYLYYGNPLYFFDYCKTNFSRNVSIIHDYDLYEFTLIVRR